MMLKQATNTTQKRKEGISRFRWDCLSMYWHLAEHQVLKLEESLHATGIHMFTRRMHDNQGVTIPAH